LSLDKFFKISGRGAIPDETAKSTVDELIEKYRKMTFFKEKYGFIPVSVWMPTKRGIYRELISEYSKYCDEGLIPVKRHWGVTGPFKTGVTDRYIPISLRIPQVDEWVFAIWGGKGYTVYNCFLGHTIEYIIFGRLGAKKYIGGTINKTILYINKDFYEKHKHLVPQDYEVVFLEEDATEMRNIPSNSIDLIWASPPYWKAERLKSDHPHELANAETYDEFLELYAKTFKQMYRVMKSDRYVVLQVGDVRFEHKFYPLHVDTIRLAEEAKLQLHDIVILVNINPFASVAAGRAEQLKYTVKSHEYILVFKR